MEENCKKEDCHESGYVVSNQLCRLMAASLEIGDTFCGEGQAVATDVVLTIREGKFHQVKRMFEAVGCRVVFLKRLSMGSLLLDERLKPGEYRRLTKEELDRLKGLE